MEERHTSRLQPVENEVVILQGKIKDRDANGGRDLFIVKKRFGSLPLFDGHVDKYADRLSAFIRISHLNEQMKHIWLLARAVITL